MPRGPPCTKAAGLWNAAARKTQALLAVDVSGSMLERTDNGTRLAIVQKSTARAVAAVSPTTVASLWIYSLHVGSRADDYRQLTGYAGLGVSKSLGALDDAVAGSTRTSAAGAGSTTRSPPPPAGQIGVAARLRQHPRRRRRRPERGRLRPDPRAAEEALAAAKDPKRPVRVVVLGIGGRADEAAMRQVVAITGGQYVSTETVEDLSRP